MLGPCFVARFFLVKQSSSLMEERVGCSTLIVCAVCVSLTDLSEDGLQRSLIVAFPDHTHLHFVSRTKLAMHSTNYRIMSPSKNVYHNKTMCHIKDKDMDV